MDPVSISVPWWGASLAKSVYSAIKTRQFMRQERQERRTLREEIGELDNCITEAQNRVYGGADWERSWQLLDDMRTGVYSLSSEIEKVPPKNMTWKEKMLEYRDKLDEGVALRKSITPVRQLLRDIKPGTSAAEVEAAGTYIIMLDEALRDRNATVEDYLQKFESEHSATRLADLSKQNRAKAFVKQAGMAADGGTVAYVSACVARIYNSPPDWVPFPEGQLLNLHATHPKSNGNRTEVRCRNFGIDRVVFTWDYNKLPTPQQIAKEARSAARWGWQRIECVVADKLDESYKKFVASYASPGLLLYARELSTNTTTRDRSKASEAFVHYFTDYGKPRGLKELLAEKSKDYSIDTSLLHELGFGKKGIRKLEKAGIICDTYDGRVGVLPV